MEIVDSAMAMSKLSYFYLGLLNEWLESMTSLIQGGTAGNSKKGSFPIMVKGECEMFSLGKLYSVLSEVMPESKVKILKMSKSQSRNQYIDKMIQKNKEGGN